MSYQIIRASSVAELERLVRLAQEQGWKPQGGVAVVLLDDGHHWQAMQAMVKE